MTMLSTVVERLGNLLDAFDGLLGLARRFRGFLAFAAFMVMVGLFAFSLMFSEGSFDLILANFSNMHPDDFYHLVMVALVGTMLLLGTLIVLGYVDISRRKFGTAVVDEGEGGRADEHVDTGDGFIKRGGFLWPGGVQLPPLEDPPVLRQPVPLPPERIFVSYAERDYPLALKLAGFLRSKKYYVWNLEDAAPYITMDVATEQAILRSDMVVSLLSNSFAESLRVRVEAEFAAENRKPVIGVLTEEPNEVLARRFPPHNRLTMFGDWERESVALYARLREISARGLRQPDVTEDNPEILDIDSELLDALGLPKPELEAVPLVVPASPQPASQPARKPEKASPKALPENTNPFIYGVAVRPEWFVGRHEALNGITGRLGMELQSVSVVADRRMGKTSLLRYVTSRAQMLLPRDQEQVTVYINMQDARAKTPERIMRLLRLRIARELRRDLWPESADGDLTAMAESFEELADRGTKLVLCLDEFENVMAYSELNDVIEQFRSSGAVSQIGMVVATAHDLATLTETGGITSPFYNIFQTIHIGLMPRKEWVNLVRLAYARGGREVHDAELAIIGKLAGGHPSLTQMAGAVVWQARAERWDKAEIRAQYLGPASKILTSTWARLSEMERAAVREAMGILSDERAPEEAWKSLQRRGILTAENEVFCAPFADLVMSEEL